MTYGYSPLPAGNIRLIRLMPHRDKTLPIRCDLFDYPLQRLMESTHHLYDALSYVWGSGEKTHEISIRNCSLRVTANVHTALLRLRDRSFERIVWVDAICINQEDREERKQQVQSMAMIYSMASRVIVWLGEADAYSDDALVEIHKAADEQPINNSQEHRGAILKLLQRPWFKRIWVRTETLKIVKAVY